jgi:hypothetical protein
MNDDTSIQCTLLFLNLLPYPALEDLCPYKRRWRRALPCSRIFYHNVAATRLLPQLSNFRTFKLLNFQTFKLSNFQTFSLSNFTPPILKPRSFLNNHCAPIPHPDFTSFACPQEGALFYDKLSVSVQHKFRFCGYFKHTSTIADQACDGGKIAGDFIALKPDGRFVLIKQQGGSCCEKKLFF